MANIFQNTATLFVFAAEAFHHRHVYGSARDAWRSFVLRVRMTNLGRRFRSAGTRAVYLRGQTQPLHIRVGTSDILLVKDIFEKEEYGPIREFHLPRDSVVLDLGGNVGLASRYISGLCPDAMIVAVEPDASNMAALRTNCQHLLDSGRMQTEAAFIAALDGSAGIDRSVEAMGFRKIEPAIGGDVIPCISMPSLIRKHSLERIDLLKCDIEGSESELFASCGPWIQRVRNMVVETHAPYSPQALYRDLRAAGWQHELVSESGRGEFCDCFLRGTGGASPSFEPRETAAYHQGGTPR